MPLCRRNKEKERGEDLDITTSGICPRLGRFIQDLPLPHFQNIIRARPLFIRFESVEVGVPG